MISPQEVSTTAPSASPRSPRRLLSRTMSGTQLLQVEMVHEDGCVNLARHITRRDDRAWSDDSLDRLLSTRPIFVLLSSPRVLRASHHWQGQRDGSHWQGYSVYAHAWGCGGRNWGLALVAGTVAISMAQLLSTFLRDCAFEFGVH